MDRVQINESYRGLLDDLKKSDILGFGLAENKDIFLLAVSLGYQNPTEYSGRKFSFVRFDTFKANDEAMLSATLLGSATSDDEVDDFSEYEKFMEYSERCAESGFKVLQKMVSDAHGDKEIIEARLLKKLDQLYMHNVEDNL